MVFRGEGEGEGEVAGKSAAAWRIRRARELARVGVWSVGDWRCNWH